MSSFLVRIELHNAIWSDYNALHVAMERAGFSRLIQSDSGKWFRLPTAEYKIVSSDGVVAIRDRARNAANLTGKANAVLAVDYSSSSWIGMSEA
jgi:hypothetical protein